MAKKNQVTKFIAIDNDYDQIISVGTHSEVKREIELWADDNDLSVDDMNDRVEVYEIKEKRMIDAINKGVEVHF